MYYFSFGHFLEAGAKLCKKFVGFVEHGEIQKFPLRFINR